MEQSSAMFKEAESEMLLAKAAECERQRLRVEMAARESPGRASIGDRE
jgi:hypothetical protein